MDLGIHKLTGNLADFWPIKLSQLLDYHKNEAIMRNRNLPPVHPGEILREDYINEYSLTITEVAEGLGILRANLSAIVNGRAGISPEMAVKLAEAFGNTAQFWINLQKNYELWHVERTVNCSKTRHFLEE